MMRVIYLESYQLSMELVIEHNASRHPENLPGHIDKLSEIQAAFETQVTENPKSCPVNYDLERYFGLQFREYHKDGYRILYRVDDSKAVIVTFIFMSQFQKTSRLLEQFVFRR
ncbi:type II toxin-antitoxin system RelE/ParE family toxin [Endozoicomonas acroporae]|uniref:type II toxin-antitoxin system RelE/ParE family toxin n=1 Tax=Endozoicomonas acroporae TaxID=1701104 RepID=UPI0011AF6278|nr:type II toxin-antitoxin system RelE/ParE family toxin [Endozoicomonas acroporae]